MKLSQVRSLLAPAFGSLILYSLIAVGVEAADECQPHTWKKRGLEATSSLTAQYTPKFTPSAFQKRAEPGEINCRNWGNTYSTVNYYTCTELSNKYDIDVEHFFMLNPELTLDCKNIKPNTAYCVSGFVEPVRATDGKCGPNYKNATCVGQVKACCNAQTWTCGDTEADCAPGTCYEGLCAGHKVYTTDGKCGSTQGGSLCAGKWGACCSQKGVCGNGPEFCGAGLCQSGNCTVPAEPTGSTGPLPWQEGTSKDGTCGPSKGWTCGVIWGMCCGSTGLCGDFASDCGTGCQPKYGACDNSSGSATPSTSTSRPVSASSSALTTTPSKASTTPAPVATTTSKAPVTTTKAATTTTKV